MNTIRAYFFPNQGNFFNFQKEAGKTSPLPLLLFTLMNLLNASICELILDIRSLTNPELSNIHEYFMK